MPDGSASLDSALAMMSAAFGHEGVSRMRTIAQRATDLEPAANRHRAVALELLGAALTLQGDFERARPALAEAVRLAGEESSPRAFSLAQLAVIYLREGDADSALAYAKRAQAVVELPRMQASIANVATHCVVAHLCSRRGDLKGTAVAVDRANAMLPRLTEGFWWLMIETRILLAPVLLALGHEDEAAARLDEAGELLAEHPDAGTLPEWHQEIVRNMRATGRRAPQANALSDAERRILRLLASDLTLREIGRELYISLNTVKTHTHSIYRKLEVSSRAEAVRASRSEATATGSGSPG